MRYAYSSFIFYCLYPIFHRQKLVYLCSFSFSIKYSFARQLSFQVQVSGNLLISQREVAKLKEFHTSGMFFCFSLFSLKNPKNLNFQNSKLSTDFPFILKHLLSSEYLLFYERKVGYYTNRQDGFPQAFFFPIAQALGCNSNPIVS